MLNQRSLPILSLSLILLPSLAFAASASSSSSSSVPSSPDTASLHHAQVMISQQSGVEVRGDFQVGPTRFVLEMDPGEERSIEVQLTSREGEERSFDLSIEDFSVSNDGTDNIQFYGNGSGPFSAKSWVTPLVPSIKVNHGERAFIPVKVKVPANASVGDHYSVVLFQRRTKDASKDGFNIIPRVGALLLITVKGDLIRHGTLEKFAVSKPVYWSLPAYFGIQYRNTGTVHIVPKGHIDVKNIFGITVDEISIRDWYVLRNSLRRREILWQPHFALGYYTATLTLAADGQDPAQPISVSFWMIPALPVLLALLAIFAVSFLVQLFFSRFELRKRSA